MSRPRKKSPKSSEIKDSPSILTRTRSNAKRRKETEPTGPTSTPKTFPASTEELIRDRLDESAIYLSRRQSDLLRSERAELLWRYKASRLINQKLRSKLITLESKIFELGTGVTLNTTKSTSTDESGRLTYEAGQWKTSSNT